MCKSQCGTLHYCPPEILLQKPYNPFKCDVFSLGTVLFFMITLLLPFELDDEQKLDLCPQAKEASRKLGREIKTLLNGICFILSLDAGCHLQKSCNRLGFNKVAALIPPTYDDA